MQHHRDPAVQDLLHSIQHLDDEELEDQIGIVVAKDGTVRDVFDCVNYASVTAWAEAQVGEKDEHFHRHHGEL